MRVLGPPDREARTDASRRESTRPMWRRAGAVIVAVLLAGLGVMVPGSAASAASLGPGVSIGPGPIGAYVADSDGHQIYCIDSGAPSPLGEYTSGPSTATSLTTHTGGQLGDDDLAQLNYALSRWGDSSDPTVTSAVAMFVWQVADPVTYASHGMSGDDWYIRRVPEDSRAAVLANLATIRTQTAANAAANPVVDVAVSMSDQYNGTLSLTVTPASLTGSVTLTGARFTDGATSKTVGSGTYPIVGTPASGAPSYQVTASASYTGPGIGPRVNLYSTPGAQRMLAAGTQTALTDTASSPVINLDFQPAIATQVTPRYVPVGEAFVDRLTVRTVGTGDWIRVGGTPVRLTATGTLYGPFDAPPTQSQTVPAGAPVAGHQTLSVDHVGSYTTPGTLTASTSGFYTWVWRIDKTIQGGNARYLRGSFTDWFARADETHVTPFQPVAVSTADTRLATPGDAVSDTITVSSSNGAWLQLDEAPIPVAFTGTAYQVPDNLPPTQLPLSPTCSTPMPTVLRTASLTPTAPDGASVIGTVEVTATGPGTYTSPPVVLPEPGFVTWVWQVCQNAQPEQYRDYLADSWVDNYGVPVETTSVRHPLSVTSELREYNVHLDGRAFDEITVSGLPDDHGDFTGDGYWGPDLDQITHTVYGPLAEADLTDTLDLATAPVLTSITTPARNGVWHVGYTDSDEIRPTQPGYYVLVSHFDGDDRVQPFTSSPADVLERFYVPAPPPPGVDVHVSTRARDEALVGHDFSDTAVVTGSNIPDGAYLVFEAYGPFDTPPAAGTEGDPFYVSDQVRLTGPGRYDSGPTQVPSAGQVFWVETLYTGDGQVLARGVLGEPGETTHVTSPAQTTPTPTPTSTPPVPASTPTTPPLGPTPLRLAETGTGDWLPIALVALVAASTGGILLFGRRLAQHRQRTGYVREEELPPTTDDRDRAEQ